MEFYSIFADTILVMSAQKAAKKLDLDLSSMGLKFNDAFFLRAQKKKKYEKTLKKTGRFRRPVQQINL
jgi:hypothetical protein